MEIYNTCWDSSLKEVGVDERPLKAGPNSVALECVETRKEIQYDYQIKSVWGTLLVSNDGGKEQIDDAQMFEKEGEAAGGERRGGHSQHRSCSRRHGSSPALAPTIKCLNNLK
ncbi:hypothetical protein Hanom_Chr09g00801341 [Helianthus anomalus]